MTKIKFSVVETINPYTPLNMIGELHDDGKLYLAGEVAGVNVLYVGDYRDGILHLARYTRVEVPIGVSNYTSTTYVEVDRPDVDMIDYVSSVLFTVDDFQAWAEVREKLDEETMRMVLSNNMEWISVETPILPLTF